MPAAILERPNSARLMICVGAISNMVVKHLKMSVVKAISTMLGSEEENIVEIHLTAAC